MKEVTDAMPAVGPHDLESLLAYVEADDISHLPIPHSWLHCINCLLQCLQDQHSLSHPISYLRNSTGVACTQLVLISLQSGLGTGQASGRILTVDHIELHLAVYRDARCHLQGCAYELFRLVVHCTHHKGLIEIPMKALVVCCDIHIDNVAILQRPLIRNAVADHLRKQVLSNTAERSAVPCQIAR